LIPLEALKAINPRAPKLFVAFSYIPPHFVAFLDSVTKCRAWVE